MEFKKSIVLRSCLQKLRKLLNKYKTIDDIIVFGSIVKGSSSPKDLDIALILKNSTEVSQIKENIRAISKKADIETVNSIYNPLLIALSYSRY